MAGSKLVLETTRFHRRTLRVFKPGSIKHSLSSRTSLRWRRRAVPSKFIQAEAARGLGFIHGGRCAMATWRVVRDLLVAIGLALSVAVAFYAISRFGGEPATGATLRIGYFLSNVLPKPLVAWLDVIPELNQGRLAATILSFLAWWLVLMALTFGARTYFGRRRT